MQAPWWWSKTETCRSDIYVYFNVNFNVFFKLIKVHLLVSEIYIYQNGRCNDNPPLGMLHNIRYMHRTALLIYEKFWSSNIWPQEFRITNCGPVFEFGTWNMEQECQLLDGDVWSWQNKQLWAQNMDVTCAGDRWSNASDWQETFWLCESSNIIYRV